MVWTVYEMAILEGAWHPPTLPWVPPDTSPAWQAAGCAFVRILRTLYIAAFFRYDLLLILRFAGCDLTRLHSASDYFPFVFRFRGLAEYLMKIPLSFG